MAGYDSGTITDGFFLFAVTGCEGLKFDERDKIDVVNIMLNALFMDSNGVNAVGVLIRQIQRFSVSMCNKNNVHSFIVEDAGGFSDAAMQTGQCRVPSTIPAKSLID